MMDMIEHSWDKLKIEEFNTIQLIAFIIFFQFGSYNCPRAALSIFFFFLMLMMIDNKKKTSHVILFVGKYEMEIYV